MSGRPGIIMPQAAYRFRVSFHVYNVLFDEDISAEVMQQVISAGVDFIGKKITILVRETVNKTTFDAVTALSSAGAFPEIELLGNGQVLYGLRPSDPKLIAHDLVFAYADEGILTHKMVWSFDKIKSTSPKPR